MPSTASMSREDVRKMVRFLPPNEMIDRAVKLKHEIMKRHKYANKTCDDKNNKELTLRAELVKKEKEMALCLEKLVRKEEQLARKNQQLMLMQKEMERIIKVAMRV